LNPLHKLPVLKSGEGALKKLITTAILCAAGCSAALSQGSPTASRVGDLQLGGTYSSADSDYVDNRIKGFGIYGNFDFSNHYGVEVSFHQLKDPNSDVYERTYQFGGRYMRHYNIFTPYVKAMYGRGVFNFPQNVANLAYNMVVGGAGVDVAVHPRINVRAEFEYQRWFGFPPNGLTPSMINVGVAYHFPAGKPKKVFASH
jgi:opacity protein-like surface antigen